MQRAAEAWWRYWQPDAVAVRQAAEADRIDRAVTDQLRAISHDIADATTELGIRIGPSWQELHRRRYPWLHHPHTNAATAPRPQEPQLTGERR
jgi:hypothetical protein